MPRSKTDGLDPDRAREIVEECYGEVLAFLYTIMLVVLTPLAARTFESHQVA